MTPARYTAMATGSQPIMHGRGGAGLVERAPVRGLFAIVGRAVGGTSHLYTAVTVPPRSEIFTSAWPSGLTEQSLAPCLERVAAMIAPRPIEAEPPRTRILADAGREMGAACTRLPLAMTRRQDGPPAGDAGSGAAGLRAGLVEWLRGGPSYRKRTLDQTYLAQAERRGAILLDSHEVIAIEPRTCGYEVTAIESCGAVPQRRRFTAPRVVLAAGTLGTVRLLLHCRERFGTLSRLSDRLGHGFYTNGDSGGALLTLRDDLVDDDGPPVTAWLDLWAPDRLFLMETGFAPLGAPCSDRVGARRRRLWTFAVMGFDQTPGVLRLDGDGELACSMPPRAGGFSGARRERMRDLARAIGARLLAPPELLAGHLPVTVHPLGGVALADSPRAGVASPSGELFGYPGLYVADGSLLPTPTGVAPSMTIAALAEHVAAHVVAP